VIRNPASQISTGMLSIILNDMIGKATLYSNPVQHNVLWIAYCGVAAIVCVATKGRLFYRKLPLHV